LKFTLRIFDQLKSESQIVVNEVMLFIHPFIIEFVEPSFPFLKFGFHVVELKN